MRLGMLGVGLLGLAVHIQASPEDGSTKYCPPDCTILVTVDESDATTTGHCKPVVPSRIEVQHSADAEVEVAWKMDKSEIRDGFRFSKGAEGRGIRLIDGDPPTYAHGGASAAAGAPQRFYRWTVSKPTTASEKVPRQYEVRVLRRRDGGECAAADPVIVNMN